MSSYFSGFKFEEEINKKNPTHPLNHWNATATFPLSLREGKEV